MKKYLYSKESGLTHYNGEKFKLQVDIVSDLHLDFYLDKNDSKKSLLKFINDKILKNHNGKKEVIVVGGDISHTNYVSREFLVQLSKFWEYVLVIPGNHDYYGQGDRYSLLVESMNDVENVKFLMDKEEIVEVNGIKFAGTFMAYNLHSLGNYIMWKQILNDSRFMTREFVNKRNIKDVEYYNKVIQNVDVFVSHIPIVNLDGLETTKNLFLNVDVNPIEGVLYVSGHTHKNRTSVEVYSDGFQAINASFGYPEETKYMEDALYSVCIK